MLRAVAPTRVDNLTDTWDDAGTTFTAIKMNVTDTNSDAASLLMDLQVGGSSKFNVSKGGNGNFGGDVFVGGQTDYGIRFDTSRVVLERGGLAAFVTAGAVNSIVPTGAFAWRASNSATAGQDLFLRRDDANILAQHNDTNAQTFNIYNTFTDASNYERGFLKWGSNVLDIGADSAGTGTDRALRIVAGGNECLRFETSGNTTVNDSSNIVLGTTTGTKIGTGTSQKLGFFNATPVVQQTAPASLTDNSGGTADDTIEAVGDTTSSDQSGAINNNFAELTEEVNQIRTVLTNLGLAA